MQREELSGVTSSWSRNVYRLFRFLAIGETATLLVLFLGETESLQRIAKDLPKYASRFRDENSSSDSVEGREEKETERERETH